MKLISLLLLFISNLSLGQIGQDTLKTNDPSETKYEFKSDQLDDMESGDSDTIAQKKDFFLKRWLVNDYPNPKKGLFIGLVIPGGGQIYNGSFWKVPLVYGAYGTVIFLINENSRQYNIFQEAVIARLDADLTDDFEEIYTDVSQLRTIRDKYQKIKEYAYFALIGVAILSVAESFVDGHLKDFDISDDLSFKFKPSFAPTIASTGPAVGIGLSFSFR